ncbi:uncharacterized protein LOC136078240 [Hydra vulgaris]|uniref:Uncharacterized protein LOC136078240 n=1 Tax=Hydra vulgaris TaxID=6087 RepID=A0ABM4BKN0_HYDVU
MDSMSRLFDITNSKCAIFYCNESSCLGCERKIHINCKCEKSARISLIKLKFIQSQRNKEGDKAKVVIGSIDYKEVERKRKAIEQNSKKEHDLKKFKEKEIINICYLKKTYDEFLKNFNNEVEWSNSELECSYNTENSHVLDKSEDFKLKRNYMKIQNTAIAAIRYEVSNTAAAIASGFLKDLVEANIVPESAIYLLLDKNKVHRANDKVMSECQDIGENRFECEDISCILFDGRSDKTNVLTFNDEAKKFYPSIQKEDHYTLTDGYGKYLHHLTKEEIPKKSKIKPAEHIANKIFQWCNLHGVKDSLKFIGCNSTVTNTGHNGGIIHCLEARLRKL